MRSEHVYRPRGSAVAVLECRDPELILSGPAGTGKSRACLEKMNLLALKYPGMSGIILRKTAASLGSTALKTWRRDVIPEALASGLVTYYGGSPVEPPQYRYANGSRIFVGGMDKPSKIMSSEYDVAYVQEATELNIDDWEAIITRLRNGVIPYQQIVADCNPDAPTHWLLLRAQEGKLRMINCLHEDNPMLFADDGSMTVAGEAYISKLDGLTGVRYKRLRRGLWVAAEGLIYEEFNPAYHVVDQSSVPMSWPRFWSIDFGFNHPFVLQCWAEDPDGRLYLYKEIYHTQRTVDEHAETILRATEREPKPQFILADHDAENRARFENKIGQGTRLADKRVLHGIQMVQARLKLQADGMPRVLFMRDAVIETDPSQRDAGKPASTIDEITSYVWAKSDAPGKKEQPVKLNDDGMDAMRYICTERDPMLVPKIRFM